MFAHFFINRPVFACVISLLIILIGLVSVFTLPVAQFPDIVPPTVSIRTSYPGANAEDVVNSVCIPIEQVVNGVDDMIYINSSCASDGSCTITVTFEVGTDPDMATVNVQNRVKQAEPVLPEEVRRQGVNVQKRASNFVMFLSIIDSVTMKTQLENKKVGPKKEKHEGLLERVARLLGMISDETEEDDLSARLSEEAKAEEAEDVGYTEVKDAVYLSNYTNLYIKDTLARVDGVGDVMVFDTKTFSMRLWLDPEIMAARKISVQEILAVLREQNVQVASGRIGESPVPAGQVTNIPILTLGRLADVEQFGNIVLRTGSDTQVLKLKDVAVVELGSLSYAAGSRMDGVSACALAVAQRPGANSLTVAHDVLKEMRAMRKEMRRNGLDFFVVFNATKFVEVSILEVVETLILAVIFVVATVYVFLQDWRAALIPTLTIPVSLIGAFFFMMMFGFTINTLTLFGLILVIGIVVDDSIVVVENTQRIIDEERCDPKTAAHKSMDQVAGPVVATALVLMSVFIPTAMIGGIVGQIYKQFALTIASAVGISGLCAMTLSPALCAIFLRHSVDPHKKFFGFRIFNFCFDTLAAAYLFVVKRMIFGSLIMLLLWFGLIFVLYQAMTSLPTGFLPNEDQGGIFVDVKLPDGASMERTENVVRRVQDIVDRISAETGDSVAHKMMITGYSMMDSAASSNAASGILSLSPWDERPTADTSAEAIAAKLNAAFGEIPEAKVQVFVPPPIMGLGMANGLALQLLDKRPFGNDILATTAQDVIVQATADVREPTGTVMFGMCNFSTNYPRYYLDIDREKLKKMGISLNETFASLQANFGSVYVNDFNVFNRVFRVMMIAKGEFRQDGEQILDYRVKNAEGKMVPFRSFATLRDEVGPLMLTRYNLYPSAAVTLMVRPDKSTGQGIERVEEICNALPDGFGYDWSGMTYQEKNVGSSTQIIFALSIIFSFLVLCAQYESWSTPIIIMMAVPLGVAGSLAGVVCRALIDGSIPEINIYTQIGLVLMVGLSAKNAILITEFARDRRREGSGIAQAAYEAGRLRLRPIMMTSYAFILGVLPLVFAKGAGAAGRQAIGTAVFGGMLTETMVGIFVTPVLFVLLQTVSEWTESLINSALGGKKVATEKYPVGHH